MRSMPRIAFAAAALFSVVAGQAQTPLERGDTAFETERYREAKASLDDCAAAIPDWMHALAIDAPPDVYANLGSPNSAVLIVLGKAQALTDDINAAEASFSAALELDPQSADARQGLAIVQQLRAEATGGAPASGAAPGRAAAASPAPANPAAAFRLFSRSCDFGHAEGCILTGVHYDLGRGLPGGGKPDRGSAETYYGLACKADRRLCGASAIESATRFVQSADSR